MYKEVGFASNSLVYGNTAKKLKDVSLLFSVGVLRTDFLKFNSKD